MAGEEEPEAALDAAERHVFARVDEAIGDLATLQPGEIVVGWVVLAATRHPNGGGQVLRLMNPTHMPPWELKGYLTEALDDVANEQYNTAPEVEQ